MGNSAPNSSTGRTWERAATRTAILAAARRVAERDGVLDMSLTSVAKEAGFAPTSVYAYFTSKNDLLLAVIADDLSTLARAMRGSFGYEDADSRPEPAAQTPNAVANPPEATSTPAEPVAEAPQREMPPAAAPVQPDSPAGEDLGKASEQPARVPSGTASATLLRRLPVVEVRRNQGEAPADDSPAAAANTLAQLQETVAKLETRPVDAWLERRLREFERALAALEGRQVDRSAADSALETRMRELQQGLDALEKRQDAVVGEAQQTVIQRLETSERKTREHASDLESQLAEFSNRLTHLENLAFITHPEQAAPAPETLTPAREEQPAEAHAPADPEAVPPAQGAEEQPPMESYLMTARRSAQAAASAQRETTRHQQRWRPSLLTAAIFVASVCVVLLLVGLAVYFRAREIGAASIRPTHGMLVPAGRIAADTSGKPRTPTIAMLANAGNPDAELVVGLAYLEGRGLPRNAGQAAAWLARAAAQGQPLAQYKLATLYQDGVGVPRSATQAFRWFSAAAARGNRKAMHSLGVAYAEGWGTSKNFQSAAKWFLQAADEGFVNSQFDLAVLEERGLGVPQSLTEAYKWYAIAAGQGDHEAEARVTAIASQISPEELAATRHAVDGFKAAPVDPSANGLPSIAGSASAP